MGNCQAIDAAALVIQHPSGRIERLYAPVSARDIMRTNPGHYVSLIIPLPAAEAGRGEDAADRPPPGSSHDKSRLTRVKLLRPSEMLALGHAYRLITSREVMKVLRSKRYAKMKQQHQRLLQQPSEDDPSPDEEEPSNQSETEASDTTKNNQQNSGRTLTVNPAAVRTRTWRPSLQSIAEVAG